MKQLLQIAQRSWTCRNLSCLAALITWSHKQCPLQARRVATARGTQAEIKRWLGRQREGAEAFEGPMVGAPHPSSIPSQPERPGTPPRRHWENNSFRLTHRKLGSQHVWARGMPVPPHLRLLRTQTEGQSSRGAGMGGRGSAGGGLAWAGMGGIGGS